MNSNYGKTTTSQKGSLNNYEFDFGVGGANRSRSLNDHKQQTSSFSSSSLFSSTQTRPTTTSSSWQPNKPSWTHQPAPSHQSRPGPNAPTSMVGDISGKSWNSSAPTGSGAGIGMIEKNPNLFGDLLSTARGSGKTNSNIPLKNATPASTPAKNVYFMNNLADALPKTNNPVKTSSNWGSSVNSTSYPTAYNNINSSGGNKNINKNVNLGGPSIQSMSGGGVFGMPMSSNKDPFGSLLDFGAKPAATLNAAQKSSSTSTGDFPFGKFENASKSSVPSFPLNGNSDNSMGSSSVSDTKLDDFGMPGKDSTSQNQPPLQYSGVDPLDMLFSSSSTSTQGAPMASEGLGVRHFSEADDWGLDSGFGGCNDVTGTTELEGLPPPPAGVSASGAKSKGMDNYKQGQYADAIKWLSWAVVLLENSGDTDSSMEVLSCRASCYKEVGEYKKAVADCSKVLEHDGANVSALVQRALLYESIEKYKLGAEDLRTVLKIDPGNRIARSTIHRLTKLAD